MVESEEKNYSIEKIKGRWDEFFTCTSRNFGEKKNEKLEKFLKEVVDEDSILVAVTNRTFTKKPKIIGGVLSFLTDITVPGDKSAACRGVSSVTVSATHRRQGILKKLFYEQHKSFLEKGNIFAALTATEATIYQRFGYGPVNKILSFEVNKKYINFISPNPEKVEYISVEEAKELLPPLYEKWQKNTPAAINISNRKASQELEFSDYTLDDFDGQPLHYLYHHQGYASYRYQENDQGNTIHVHEVVSYSDQAEIALWNALFGVDIVNNIEGYMAPDSILPYLVDNFRAMKITRYADGLWVRILDVKRALEIRGYAQDFSIELHIYDDFLQCGGLFHLDVVQGTAQVTTLKNSDTTSGISMDISTLSMIYFGGHQAVTLFRSGLITGSFSAVTMLQAGLMTEREPNHGTDF